MYVRVLFGLITLCCFSYVYAAPEVFPEKLEGSWLEEHSGDNGNIVIRITKKEDNKIWGTIMLTGSAYCKEIIPFRGEGAGDRADIVGDAPIICGHGGKLKGYVLHENDALYTGEFSYKWFGITWARGTFRLVPKQ